VLWLGCDSVLGNSLGTLFLYIFFRKLQIFSRYQNLT
jgi:hypothetical protein